MTFRGVPTRTSRAIVVSRIYLPEGGAAAYRLAAVVHALEASRYEVTVLTTRAPGAPRTTANIRRWPVLRDRTGAVRGYLQYASFDIPLFFRLIFCARADFVLVEPPPTTGVVSRIVCALRRIPYFYYAADVSSVAAQGIGISRPVVHLLRAVESWVLRGARGVLTVSEGVSDALQTLGVGKSAISVVGTGVDTDNFSLAGEAREPGYPYFVYAGTMSELQGAGVFIDAFAAVATTHPSVRLLLFGSGVEVPALSARAADIGRGRIEFRGVVGSDELAPWLRGAIAGLASSKPSAGYEFAYATKALVSLSCGARVIYAGTGPVGDLITENAAGWVVDWTPEAVAAAMRASLDSECSVSERKRMSDLVVASFSLNAVGKRAVELMTAGGR